MVAKLMWTALVIWVAAPLLLSTDDVDKLPEWLADVIYYFWYGCGAFVVLSILIMIWS